MTLAVARIVGKRIAVAADTLLTEHELPLPITKGIVKLCMLPGDICVTFSNSPELAERAFKQFSRLYPEGTGFNDVVAFFEHSSADAGVDYLLAFSRVPRIVKISDGHRCETASKTQWIGDAIAFRRFRQAEEVAKRRDAGRAINAVMFMDEIEKSPASALYSAMREVVADRNVASVGGFVTVVSNRDPGFRYSVYSDMLFNWPEGKASDFIFDLNDQIDFGASGENAGYAIAQISTGYLGLNIVGFYYLKAGKAFLFVGERNGLPTECRVLNDVLPGDIAIRLSEAVGFDAQWLLTIMAPAPDRANSVARRQGQTDSSSGVGLSMMCHANTLPS